MKHLYITLFLISQLLISCQRHQEVSQADNIPALLDRPERIRYGKEWDEVQNQYAKYTQNIRNGKDQATSYLNLAALFTSEARVTGEHGHYYPGALTLLDRAMTLPNIREDERFYALTSKAGVLLSQHEFQQALETAKSALAINDHNAMLYGVLVDSYVELGDYQEAISAVDKMVSLRPDLRSYSRVSYVREILGDIPGATDAMMLAIEAGPPGSEEKAWCMLQLAGLKERQGEAASAKQICDAILQERVDYPFAKAMAGRLLIEQGEEQKGLSMLEDACEIIPEVGFYVDLAKFYSKKGNTEMRDSLTTEILAMIDDDIKSGHNMDLALGEVYAELQQNYPKALEVILKEYAQRPKNAEVNQQLASVYDKIGDESNANKHRLVAEAPKALRKGSNPYAESE